MIVVTQHIVGGRYAAAIFGGQLRNARGSSDSLGYIGLGDSGPV